MTVGIETWISHVQVLGGSQNWGTPISSLKIGTGLGCWGRPFLGTPQRSCITLIHYHFPITFHNIHTKKTRYTPKYAWILRIADLYTFLLLVRHDHRYSESQSCQPLGPWCDKQKSLDGENRKTPSKMLLQKREKIWDFGMLVVTINLEESLVGLTWACKFTKNRYDMSMDTAGSQRPGSFPTEWRRPGYGINPNINPATQQRYLGVPLSKELLCNNHTPVLMCIYV
jgi:hypothetical protein